MVVCPLLSSMMCDVVATCVLLLGILPDSKEEVVTVENFANVCEWFGPFQNGQQLLDKVSALYPLSLPRSYSLLFSLPSLLSVLSLLSFSLCSLPSSHRFIRLPANRTFTVTSLKNKLKCCWSKNRRRDHSWFDLVLAPQVQSLFLILVLPSASLSLLFAALTAFFTLRLLHDFCH